MHHFSPRMRLRPSLRMQLEVVRQIPELRQFHDEAVERLPCRQRGVDAGKGVVHRDGAWQTYEELTEICLAMPCINFVCYLQTDLLWHAITTFSDGSSFVRRREPPFAQFLHNAISPSAACVGQNHS